MPRFPDKPTPVPPTLDYQTLLDPDPDPTPAEPCGAIAFSLALLLLALTVGGCFLRPLAWGALLGGPFLTIAIVLLARRGLREPRLDFDAVLACWALRLPALWLLWVVVLVLAILLG